MIARGNINFARPVRATIVDCVDAAAVGDDEDRASLGRDDAHPFVLEPVQRAKVDGRGGCRGHGSLRLLVDA